MGKAGGIGKRAPEGQEDGRGGQDVKEYQRKRRHDANLRRSSGRGGG